MHSDHASPWRAALALLLAGLAWAAVQGEERKFDYGKYVLNLKKRMLGLWVDLLKVDQTLIYRLEKKRKFDRKRAFNRFISARNQCFRLGRAIAEFMPLVRSSDPARSEILALNPLIRDAKEEHAACVKRLKELAPADINAAIAKANQELESEKEAASGTTDFPVRSLRDGFDPASSTASEALDPGGVPASGTTP